MLRTIPLTHLSQEADARLFEGALEKAVQHLSGDEGGEEEKKGEASSELYRVGDILAGRGTGLGTPASKVVANAGPKARIKTSALSRNMSFGQKFNELSLWLADDFPVGVQHVLPALRAMAAANPDTESVAAFLAELMASDLLDGFPMRTTVPLPVPLLRAFIEVTFADTRVDVAMDDALFTVPAAYVDKTVKQIIRASNTA